MNYQTLNIYKGDYQPKFASFNEPNQFICPCLKEYVKSLMPNRKISYSLFLDDKYYIDTGYSEAEEKKANPIFDSEYLKNFLTIDFLDTKNQSETRLLKKLKRAMNYKPGGPALIEEILFHYKYLFINEPTTIDASSRKTKARPSIQRKYKYYILKTWLLKNYKNPYPKYI